jgi:RNA polymerase sigma-70 factor (ECF subfamily)
MAITDLKPRLLVDAHNDGDDQAFGEIVRAHHQGLFAHALNRLQDVQAAEDAVQETLVRAYRALSRFDGALQLRPWLHRILTNVCHDEAARRQRDGLLIERVSSEVAVVADPADIVLDRIDLSRDVVARALAELPVSYREALLLRYVKELPYEELAAAIGVTEGNARVRVMRGRAALRRALTGSHAVVIGVLPWLRRELRPPAAVADLPYLGVASASSSAAAVVPTALVGSPLMRATEVAPQLAERIAALPQILGLVATMAVPVAAPVVGTHMADWVGGPPPATSVPADDVPATTASTAPVTAAAAAEPARATSDRPVTRAAPTTPTSVGSAAPAVEPVVRPPAAVPGGTVPSAGAATVEPPPVTALPPTAPPPSVPPAPPPPTTAPPSTATPSMGGVSTPAPAPPAAFASSLGGGQLTSVGDERTELAGPVRWDVGGTTSTGHLRGTLTFDRPALQEATATGARRFRGELSLALDDGRTYTLVLVGGTLDAPGTGTAVSASFQLRDQCQALVASGAVAGALDLQQAPIPATASLRFDGSGPASTSACR